MIRAQNGLNKEVDNEIPEQRLSSVAAGCAIEACKPWQG
jgi:hypothetical protein